MELPDRFSSTALRSLFGIVNNFKLFEIVANLSYKILQHCKPILLSSFKSYSGLKPILHLYSNLFYLIAIINLFHLTSIINQSDINQMTRETIANLSEDFLWQ